MDVLLTGAAGYIGSEVGVALQRAGHVVLGLAHAPRVAEELRARGWTPVAGDLRDAAALRRLAAEADAVVHVAHTGGPDAAAVDAGATRALLDALRGSGKPFVYTSGAWVLGPTGERVADEESEIAPIPIVAWRGTLEAEVRAARGVRSVVLRPGIAFGGGGGIPGKLARGEIPVVGDGAQRWPLVHLRDLADLYVRALDAPPGAVLHGVSTTATMRDLALLAGARGEGGEPASLPLHAAREQFGDFADALALDQVVSAARTRALLGWRPTRTSVIEEFLRGSYATAA